MKTLIASLSVLGLTGCASAIKMENVAGTWSCPRIDGVCADIASLDGQLIGQDSYRGIGGAPIVTRDGVVAVSDKGVTSAMPARAPDEVARIVFAPSVDASGHYHGVRAIYAVIKTGDWITAPDENEAAQTRSAEIHMPKVGDVDPASVETAQIKRDPHLRRPVTRAAADTPSPTVKPTSEMGETDE